MSKVRRIYVEKKDQFAVAARGLEHEVKSYLGIKDLEKVRILIRYDRTRRRQPKPHREFFGVGIRRSCVR